MAQESLVSRVLKHQKSARWRIEEAHCLSQKLNEFIQSDTLFDIPEGPKFALQLSWGGEKDSDDEADLDDKDYISLYATVSDYDAAKSLMWVAQLVCIHKDDESKHLVRMNLNEQDGIPVEESDTLGIAWFYERSKLVKDGFMVNGTIIFELRVKAWIPKMQHKRLSLEAASDPFASTALAFSADLARLLKSGDGSDVTLRAGIQNGDEIPEPLHAHRSLLAARSPVFRQMFFGSTSMAETATGAEVCLGDVDLPTASLFLEFLYTGQVCPTSWADEDVICHLLSVGRKYEVESLVEACTARLCCTIDEENAAERLMMADLLSVPKMRGAALEYICAFPARLATVQGTQAFKRLGEQRPHLALQIMANMVAPTKRPAESHSLPADLSCKTVVQLKQLCSDRGLSTSGNKQALIDRLKANS